MWEILIRFIAGGVIISVFALIGDVLKPKSFAGLFGAAPSVALVTLFLAVTTRGQTYASIEACSMVLGALAFVVYASSASYLLMRKKCPALLASGLLLLLWLLSRSDSGACC
jgi:uncharacterized membrane protein (GlpM family)